MELLIFIATIFHRYNIVLGTSDQKVCFKVTLYAVL